MVESDSLSLAFQLTQAHDALLAHLADQLTARGHEGITASALGFLAQLDCGVNHASAIAQRLGVSRQMIAKTVGEMERAGWLVQERDAQRRNRKVIRFTANGERLMADARHVLQALDDQLARQCGAGFTTDLLDRLATLTRSLAPSGD
jgi:DNA-binding MarR family transcriptional regulator